MAERGAACGRRVRGSAAQPARQGPARAGSKSQGRLPEAALDTSATKCNDLSVMVQAQLVLDVLYRHAVTDVVSLPDNASAGLVTLIREADDMRLLSVTREGEAFALAAGLWIGGRNPVVLIQNTGLLESGDSLRGTLMRMRIPVVCLVTYRGYAKLARWNGAALEPSPEVLSRPDMDSVAVVTEPTLRAWGLWFDFLRTDDVVKISTAFAQAKQLSAPVVLLVTQDMT
ncbi:MAG: hypothetical protein FJW26_21555 [Acidimicrobiia bacterium]|nr:hypothetical protein [Acidimicrobiia bacterium]